MKRISFSERQAQHLYELALENFCVGVAGCSVCNRIKSNIFSRVEMKEIAKKYLIKKWKKILTD